MTYTFGNAKFSLLTPRLARLQYTYTTAFDDRPTIQAMTRPTPIPFTEVLQDDEQLTLTGEQITIRYQGNKPFAAESLSIYWQAGEMRGTWTPATADLHNLGGTVFSLDNINSDLVPEGVHPADTRSNKVDAANLFNPWAFNGMLYNDLRDRYGSEYPRIILSGGRMIREHWDDLSDGTHTAVSRFRRYTPGILSRSGYFLLNDSDSARIDPETGNLGGTLPRGMQDWYFFAYGRDYAQALQDFTLLCGEIPMLPRWALGHWYSFWKDVDEAEIKRRVELYETHDLPLDVLVMDMQWHTPSHWCGFDWNPDLYPDPKGLLDWLHERGVRMPVNLHFAGIPLDAKALPDVCADIDADIQERIDAYESPPLDTPTYRVSHSTDDVFAYDFGKPSHAAAVFKHLIAPLYDAGVDFMWLDGQNGATPGVNNQLWTNHLFYTDMQRRFPNRRPMILSRYGGLGSHRYPVGFSGDTLVEWGILRHEVDMTARAGNVGQVYWSHDIGGHMHAFHKSPHGMPMDPELYVRWVQFGAFSPVMRIHGTYGCKRELWEYGETLLDDMRSAINLRMSLLPYWYHLTYEAHKNSLPMCRPLYLHYPEDGAAYEHPYEYLIGDRMLVAPVTETGGVRKVYLPEGYWWSWLPKSAHAGQNSVLLRGLVTYTALADLHEIPVYVRAGTILPRQHAERRAGVGVPETLVVEVYPNAPGTTAADIFDLYEDDGESMAYRNDHYSLLPLYLNADDDGLTVSAGSVQGTFDGMPSVRDFEVRVRFSRPPVAVGLDGEPLPANRWDWDSETGTLLVAVGERRVNTGWQVTVRYVQ